MEDSCRKENTPTTNPESSTTSAAGQPARDSKKRRSHRFLSVLRRVSSEWNCLLHKLKLASQTGHSDGEALDSLFESSDDDFFERIPRLKKCCSATSPEARFLEDFKKYKLLEEYHRGTHTGTSAGSLSEMAPSVESPHVPLYRALDVLRLRQGCAGEPDLESLPARTHELELTSQEAVLKDQILSRDENLGNALWEIRRARWLIPDDECEDVEQKVEQRAAGLAVKQISQDAYPQVYKDFVVNARPLKTGKRINLEDMVVVIHAGWVHEKVWESASKGLG
ncbi:hypothetical protein METBIDRAFT_11346 [Metschnikowia bicuspidata var. bicuspidata NRRL YB-4993]|uniref:Gag1-like clamp domain-containing protein n=1 Tax=Metschnikowia bicuspidata var. bicuspidata NRRL YB-4993 TaxID=869754 RepID=A0A1A0HEI0_9ASCO|nr:hypothetical protein METBIDRAFT_11346 [Metschnikowia bicuspidata var. bicuspidata NRRL YB-4993]OBA22519.1 hypothetical protein METBIDRAFT_11346 [Metschnikowia bicuspidata var. bicuspidata NRRL YB-4993]